MNELNRHLGDEDVVDVITTMPNRYHSFSVETPQYETWGRVNIHRVHIPEHRSGMYDQSKAFAVYARNVWRMTRKQRYDGVFASSSRLFTAFLAALVARRTRTRLYLDLRDIFTDTIGDVLGSSPLRITLPLFRQIERFTVRYAEQVNLVSEGFRAHFEAVDSRKSYRFFPNGIDEEFLNHDFTKRASSNRVRILYAGNIGAGQGLHHIVPEVAAQLADSYEFLIIGDGGARSALEEGVAARGLRNVRMEPPVDRTRLLQMYSEADVLFLHLDDQEAFTKVLPSKLFEYAATGKPILAGVKGYAANFICTHIENAAVFQPCDPAQFVDALGKLQLVQTDRSEFIEKFRRDAIMRGFVRDILACLGDKKCEVSRV